MFCGCSGRFGGSGRERPQEAALAADGRDYNMHAPVPKVAELGVDPKEHPTSGLP